MDGRLVARWKPDDELPEITTGLFGWAAHNADERLESGSTQTLKPILSGAGCAHPFYGPYAAEDPLALREALYLASTGVFDKVERLGDGTRKTSGWAASRTLSNEELKGIPPVPTRQKRSTCAGKEN